MDGDGSLVLDFGSSSVKAGWSGEDTPRSIFPSVISDKVKDFDKALEIRRLESLESCVTSVDTISHSVVPLTHPIQRGKITDWTAMEKLIEHTFSVELDAFPESLSSAVLICESPGATKAEREQLCHVLFEGFKVSGICFANSSVLSLFASGRTRGIVLECGAGVSYTTPIFDGFALPHAVLKLEAGGEDVTRRLQHLLKTNEKTGKDLTFLQTRGIKHQLAFCAPIAGSAFARDDSVYELPDGTTITIPGTDASACVDFLFDPDDANIPNLDGGYSSMLLKSIEMCDSDLQPDLFNNVVLAGGTSMIAGLGERIKNELQSEAGDNHLGIIANEPGYNAQKKHAPWIGGSIFASLDTFEKAVVTKQEYEDAGSTSIVHRKCV
mgnify:CR=1 FL=1